MYTTDVGHVVKGMNANQLKNATEFLIVFFTLGMFSITDVKDITPINNFYIKKGPSYLKGGHGNSPLPTTVGSCAANLFLFSWVLPSVAGGLCQRPF